MSEIKLLPCPFCQAKLKRWDYMPSVFFEHPYNGCILSGKKVLESEHDVKAWNTRKPMERILTRLEEEVTLERMDKMEDRVGKRQTTGFGLGVNASIEIVKEEGGIE